MSTVLMISIALLLTALFGCIVLWMRSGEGLVGLCGALFGAVAMHQGFALWNQWGMPLGLDTTTMGGLAGVLAGGLSIWAVVLLRKNLVERDGIETLHWDSMEAVRMLNELATQDAYSLEKKTTKLLEIGASCFGLEVGMVSRVDHDRYEVVAIQAPESFPADSGSSFSVGDTICKETIDSGRPLAIENVSELGRSQGAKPLALELGVYLGAPVRVAGSVYGTLSFAGLKAREARFSGTDKDLIGLMAQWIGTEIEKTVESQTLPKASAARPVAKPSSDPKAKLLSKFKAKLPFTTPTLHANQILRGMEGELRSLAGEKLDLELKLASKLGGAVAPRIPFDAIVRAMVENARDAMPEGGTLVIETANLELQSGKPGVLPAVAPARYVTLAFRDSGSGPDAEQLAQLYHSSAQAGESTSGAAQRLSLSAIYRILQTHGGDLSVNVESGRGSTFTIYLPRAIARARTPRKGKGDSQPASPGASV
jgi:hypothetical protein